ncbi:hypothetical protein OAT67_01760 [Bacteriovoracaceae bacterium]|nr:hypothetical protein [Bacteriovoracaceae bacterium]
MIKYRGQTVPNIQKEVSFEAKLEEISKVWILGIDALSAEEIKKCSDNSISKIFYQCNPEFISCVFEQRKEEGAVVNFQKENKKYKIYSKAYEEKGSWPGYSLWGEIILGQESKKNKEKKEFLLTDECRSLYLPQRVYQYGQSTLKNKWTWDNIDRHIFIDKHVVTNRDINEWIEQTKVNSTEEILFNKESPHLPAEFLKADQMEAFCRYRGKKVLQTQYFDAISYLPFEMDKDRQAQVFQSIVPWSRKEQSIFKVWDKLKREISDKSKDFERVACSKTVSNECLLGEKENAHFRAPSWSGHFMVMGGYLEYIKNNIHPRRNLKASSQFFKRTSPWFRLGERAYWDGDGFSYRNFNWKGEDPLREYKSFGVTFRCMKEQYTYEAL